MSNELIKITQSIYDSYNPMENPGRILIAGRKEDPLRRIVKEKTHQLCKEDQQRIENEIFGWGPITHLLTREDIFDIMIQGPQHIFVDGTHGIEKWPDHFFCQASFENFVEKISQETKILINQKDPFANGKMDNFRVHMVSPPITKEFSITLRRHRNNLFPLKDLLKQGFINQNQWEKIKELIDNRANFLIIGSTGSGKTTLLNSILGETDSSERTVIIEDTDEIITKNPLHTKMVAREICPRSLTPITLEDLVKQSLRMRPDRIVVGEVRSKEAKDLLQALATGHSGSMGTLHAQNPQQALIRLEMLIQMGAPQWQIDAIRKLIQLSLDAIISLKSNRQSKGVHSITKICSLERHGISP